MRKFGMLKKYHFGLNLHLRGLVLASLVAEGLVGVSKLLLHHACTNKIIIRYIILIVQVILV